MASPGEIRVPVRAVRSDDPRTPMAAVTVTIIDSFGEMTFVRRTPATLPVSELRERLELMAPKAIADAMAAVEGYSNGLIERHRLTDHA